MASPLALAPVAAPHQVQGASHPVPDLDTILDELYEQPPERFTALREARAAEARKRGDATLARQLRALRRPTLGAWTVNLLARQAPREVARLLELGVQLRKAQSELHAARLRELSGSRPRAVSALVERAGALAQSAGHPASHQALEEVAATLNAALADPASAAALRAGRLERPLEQVGFGPAIAVDPSAARLRLVESEPTPAPVERPAAEPRAAKAAEVALERARQTQETEEARAAELEGARASAEKEVEEAQRALVQARSALAEAERRLARQHGKIERARREVAEAERRLFAAKARPAPGKRGR